MRYAGQSKSIHFACGRALRKTLGLKAREVATFPARSRRHDAANRSVLFPDRRENAFAVLARATDLARQGKDVINLGIGQPDFPTPDHIVEAAVKAPRRPSRLHPGQRHPAAAGSGRCRSAQALFGRGVARGGDDRAGRQGHHVHGDPDVRRTRRRDPLPDPGFPIYRSMIEYTGATPVPVPIREENGFASRRKKRR